MAESISIKFVDRQVGIRYHPETSEATLADELLACEMGMQVLAAHSVELRQRLGIPVRQVMLDVVEAHTFHDMLHDRDL